MERFLPKFELPIFDGQPKNWLMWWNTFRNSVRDVLLDDFERLAILRERLSERVQRSIASLLYSPDLYEKAIQALQSRCGTDDIIVDATYESIRNLPTWNENDSARMRGFSDELNGILGLMSVSSLASGVPSPLFLRQITEKIPRTMLIEFKRHCWISKLNNVGVSDLANWLGLQLGFMKSEANQPRRQEIRRSQRQTKKADKPRVYTTMGLVKVRTSASLTSPHRVKSNRVATHSTCKRFRELPMEKRLEAVVASSANFLCFGTGHVRVLQVTS